LKIGKRGRNASRNPLASQWVSPGPLSLNVGPFPGVHPSCILLPYNSWSVQMATIDTRERFTAEPDSAFRWRAPADNTDPPEERMLSLDVSTPGERFPVLAVSSQRTRYEPPLCSGSPCPSHRRMLSFWLGIYLQRLNPPGLSISISHSHPLRS